MSGLQPDHLYAFPVAIPVAIGFQLSTLLKRAPFSPVVTGALLYALTRAPEQYRGPLVSFLRNYLSTAAVKRGINTLQAIFALGIGRQVYIYLNDLCQNNFRFRSEKANYDWPREIAVVTGAAGGIGSVFATDLAAKGVKVMAVDIAPSLPASLAENKNVFYYRCDLTSRDAVFDMAAQITRDHGHPSMLFNNAGVAYTHGTLAASEKAVRKVFDVNVVAHWWTLQAFMPHMIEARKGHIVETASMASFASTPGLGPYSCSKAAVLALHETLVQELRRHYRVPEIKLTVVHPGFVDTAMTSGAKTMLERFGALVTPQAISAAVMKNVFGGRSGQVIIPGALGFIPTFLRGFPHWITYALLRSAEASARIEQDLGAESHMA